MVYAIISGAFVGFLLFLTVFKNKSGAKTTLKVSVKMRGWKTYQATWAKTSFGSFFPSLQKHKLFSFSSHGWPFNLDPEVNFFLGYTSHRRWSILVENLSVFDEVSGWPSGLRRQTQAKLPHLGDSGLRMEAWVRIPLLTHSFSFPSSNFYNKIYWEEQHAYIIYQHSVKNGL